MYTNLYDKPLSMHDIILLRKHTYNIVERTLITNKASYIKVCAEKFNVLPSIINLYMYGLSLEMKRCLLEPIGGGYIDFIQYKYIFNIFHYYNSPNLDNWVRDVLGENIAAMVAEKNHIFNRNGRFLVFTADLLLDLYPKFSTMPIDVDNETMIKNIKKIRRVVDKQVLLFFNNAYEYKRFGGLVSIFEG